MLLFDHLRLQEMDLASEVIQEISEYAPKYLNEKQVVKRKVEKVRKKESTCPSFSGAVAARTCRSFSLRDCETSFAVGIVERVQEHAAARSVQVEVARSQSEYSCYNSFSER